MEAMETSGVDEGLERDEHGEGERERHEGESAVAPPVSQGERGKEGGAPAEPLAHEDVEEEVKEVPAVVREPEELDDSSGAVAEPVDEIAWRGRAEAAEGRVAELGDRLGAVEAAAEDLRLMVGKGERARRVDRELLIAGVVDLDGARAIVEEHMAGGATVLEAVSRVRERRPLLFVTRARGVRATVVPAVEARGARSADEVASAARETGDRRLLLRYLRMRRGEGD